MSWHQDIYNVMTGDSSINEAVSKIRYEHLPAGQDLSKNYIVFSYRKDEETNLLGGTRDVVSKYTLYCAILAPTPEKLETITSRLITYMDNKTYGNIDDIYFVSDNREKDLEENIYQNRLEFSCVYMKT